MITRKYLILRRYFYKRTWGLMIKSIFISRFDIIHYPYLTSKEVAEICNRTDQMFNRYFCVMDAKDYRVWGYHRYSN